MLFNSNIETPIKLCKYSQSKDTIDNWTTRKIDNNEVLKTSGIFFRCKTMQVYEAIVILRKCRNVMQICVTLWHLSNITIAS